MDGSNGIEAGVVVREDIVSAAATRALAGSLLIGVLFWMAALFLLL